MSDATISWFYNQDGDRKGPFTSDQIGTLIQAGVIGEHTKMWSEAVGEWTPLFRTELRALLGDKAIEPPPLPPEETPDKPAGASAPWGASWSSSQPLDPAVSADSGQSDKDAAKPASPQDRAAFSGSLDPAVRSDFGEQTPSSPPFGTPAAQSRTYPLHDNQTLGKVLQWLLWINTAIALIQGIVLSKTSGIEKKFVLARELDTDDRILAIVLIPSIITTIVFLWWKYRSTANLFNLRGVQSITPAGAVYWYFVPVAWFWKPYEAMRNLNDGYGVGDRSGLVFWWLLFWASVAVSGVVAGLVPDSVQTMQQAQFYVYGSILAYFVEAASCYIAASLVKDIRAGEARAMQ